jgi:hypothetical protein
MAKKIVVRKTATKTAAAAKKRPNKADQIDAAMKALGKSVVEIKAKKPSIAKKLSALGAAAKVLATSKEAMAAAELIEAMSAKGYWKSPGGQTPDRTLYSAITMEIHRKGKDSRFKKVGKGRFALAK